MDDSGERDWTSRARICIDFGTALSKASICLDPTLPLEVGVKPLPIGAISGAEHPLLTPSIVYVDEGRLYFGPQALEHARRGVESARDPLISFKTVLGASNVQDALQTKLRPSMDPTATFKHRDALVLYIAYLDQLIREALDLAPNMPRGVANTKRRYTSPVWRPGSGVDLAFESIFNEAAAVSQRLSRQFLLQGEGISIAQCKDALDRAAAMPGNGMLETGIFEPHAAAAAALAFTSQPTRFVVVLDIGAGTNDIAAFDFDESVEPPSLSEIKEARQCSALAGDEIDRILIELMLRKAGFDRNNPEDMKVLRAARLTARELKKDIFKHGKCTMRVGRKTITVIAKELAEDPNFRTYQQSLAQMIAASLRIVGQRASATGGAIDVVLAGGGSHLPFLPALVKHAGDSVAPGVQLRVGPLSPANPLYTSIDSSLRDVFPQISMSVGGALVEMMPAREAR